MDPLRFICIHSKGDRIYKYLLEGRPDLYVFARGTLRFIVFTQRTTGFIRIYSRYVTIYTYLFEGRQELYVLISKDDRIYTYLFEGRQDLYTSLLQGRQDLYVFILRTSVPNITSRCQHLRVFACNLMKWGVSRPDTVTIRRGLLPRSV